MSIWWNKQLSVWRKIWFKMKKNGYEKCWIKSVFCFSSNCVHSDMTHILIHNKIFKFVYCYLKKITFGIIHSVQRIVAPKTVLANTGARLVHVYHMILTCTGKLYFNAWALIFLKFLQLKISVKKLNMLKIIASIFWHKR